jgi:hypothetical protein
MIGVIKKQLILGVFILLLGLFFSPKTYAASLQSISDTISTSRPSAAAPLASNQAAAATQLSVFDNGSTYLASDSAIIYPSTGETINSGLNIASMSAQTGGNRNVYITNSGGVSNVHHQGDAFIVNITATHTIKFTTISAIPLGGHVIVTFPSTGASNIASPSASAFSFNGMTLSNPTDVKYNGVTCSSVTVTGSDQIDCVTSGSVGASTTITILIGCTAGTTSCTTFAPRLINPTKTTANICNNGQTTCTADTWKISMRTQDAGGFDLDTGSAKIATIEAVQVQATVEPTITFQIAGMPTGANNYNVNGSTSCGSESANSGIDSTATTVNLGLLTNGAINHNGQKLIVSTNGSQGYSITATSSGRFINPSSGFWLPDANGGNGLTANDTPVPTTITAGTAEFGISPCGANVPTVTPNWGGAAQTVAAGARFSNPWNTGTSGFYATIASYAGGPITSDVTVVRYAATVSASTPAGIYSNYFTYVATATF